MKFLKFALFVFKFHFSFHGNYKINQKANFALSYLLKIYLPCHGNKINHSAEKAHTRRVIMWQGDNPNPYRKYQLLNGENSVCRLGRFIDLV